MRLVVDANILIAAFLKDATTREIIFEEEIEFLAPEYLRLELKKLFKNPKIRKRLKLKAHDLDELTSIILSRITFVPEKIFISSIKQSILLAEHVEDAPYLALALALKIPLWSNDSGLKEQTAVRVYTTYELIKLLKVHTN